MREAGADMVMVYTSQTTARLDYILHELFSSVEITDSKETFTAYLGVKICYADQKFCSNTLWIVPHGLLGEETIAKQEIIFGEWKKKRIFFLTAGEFPFDVFAASFYLLARYEEYLPHEKDQYGRYSHVNSTAYKENFLNIPLVNEWMQLLETELRDRCSQSRFRLPQSTFSFVPTYDVDEAFSYLHKPWWKNVLGFFRDFLMGKFEQVVERGNVYSGRKPDPYDTFDWIESLHDTYKLNPTWFFLTIIKRGEYDKNLGAKSKALQRIYKRLSEKHNTGLHPSWQSGTEKWLLEKELGALSKILDRDVSISRNHYLRFTVPDTYRRLIAAGITDDYSMAYGNVNGFRASYAKPFYWFDVERNIATELIIHPFCFMEATSIFNQSYSVEEAAIEIQYYHDAVKKVNGEFITLFHNHFLTEQPQWIGWRNMYGEFIRKNFS